MMRGGVVALIAKCYTWKAAAHMLHSDIIVEWFYLLWLFTTNKGAHGGNFRNVYDFADSCNKINLMYCKPL